MDIEKIAIVNIYNSDNATVQFGIEITDNKGNKSVPIYGLNIDKLNELNNEVNNVLSNTISTLQIKEV